jgi:hypothetical protein
MFDSKKTENEITNLFALVGSIKTNAEAVSKQIQGAEDSKSRIDGILQLQPMPPEINRFQAEVSDWEHREYFEMF